jgi:hypothetical protein
MARLTRRYNWRSMLRGYNGGRRSLRSRAGLKTAVT